MKYANQINAVLALLGVIAVGYALSETYFNPSAQPHIVLDLEATAPESETEPPDRLGTPAANPGPGSGIVGIPGQSTRPTRSRTRPGNTLRENAPITPPQANPPTGRRSEGVARPGFNPRPANSSPQLLPAEDEEDPVPTVDPASRQERPRSPGAGARRPPARPGFTPQGTPPQPPDKRENTPPPPARSSMPEG